MPKRDVPPTASIAHTVTGAKLSAPAALRNFDAIAAVLDHWAPNQGRALEIASGTGEHIVGFARRFGGLTWTPSDIDPARRASIAAYVQDAQLPNLTDPVPLDASLPGWAGGFGDQALIVIVNLLHLISDAEAKVVLHQAAHALAPQGRLVIYGPFKRGGALTSDGDRRFHASLIAQDPQIGYKDDGETLDSLRAAGLEIASIHEMPANNLTILAHRA